MINSILLVDDEPQILLPMKELLELENKKVDTAENGLAALELLEKNTYDLIISDAKMPKMNGHELLGKVREDNSDVKFIILTGVNDFSQEALKKSGADAVFYKPLDFDILLQTISSL